MIDLRVGDCLDVLPTLAEGSVDLVLCDPPYGTTACKWDAVIPFDAMWAQLRRVVKPRGAIVFTASQPFTSALVMSNPKAFAHAWVWDKVFGANFVQAKRQPLKVHEDVLVFGLDGKQPSYSPQMTKRDKPITKGGNKQSAAIPIARTEAAKAFGESRKVYDEKFPTSVLQFSSRADHNRGHHPTQKPVALMEYLVRTYSNPGDTVLDFTMGSGTTGVACVNLGRRFIGIEREPSYADIARQRIAAAMPQQEAAE